MTDAHKHWSATAHVEGKKLMTWSGQVRHAAEAKAAVKVLLESQWRHVAQGAAIPKHEITVKGVHGINGLSAAKAYPYLWSLAGQERPDGEGQVRDGTRAAIDAVIASDPAKRHDAWLEARFTHHDVLIGFYGPQGSVKGLSALTQRAATAIAWSCGLNEGDLASGLETGSATLRAAIIGDIAKMGAAAAEPGALRLEEIGLKDLAKAIRAQAKATHGGGHGTC